MGSSHVRLCADNSEPGACFRFYASLSLCPSPPMCMCACAHVLFLSKINIKKKKNFLKENSKYRYVPRPEVKLPGGKVHLSISVILWGWVSSYGWAKPLAKIWSGLSVGIYWHLSITLHSFFHPITSDSSAQTSGRSW